MWLYNILKWLLSFKQSGNVLILPLEVSFGTPAQAVARYSYEITFTCPIDWRSLSDDQRDTMLNHAKYLVGALGVSLSPQSVARFRIDHIEVVP